MFDELRAQDAGVIGRTAAEDLHSADIQHLTRGELDAAQVRRLEAAIEPAQQRSLHGIGLFGDLLAHEVAEIALVEAGSFTPQFLHGLERSRRPRG